MKRRRWLRSERGSVSLELIFAVGFLLIPAAAILAQLPTWVGTTNAAQVAATEAARQIVLADDMTGGIAAASATAQEIVSNHGLDPDDFLDLAVTATPPGDLQRGQIVTVTVTVRGNPIRVPGLGSVGNPFDAVGSATERVDDYREFRAMSNERGSMTVWAMGMSLLLFAVGFLSLDLWSGFSARQEAAAIADSAAIAGATALDESAWRSGVTALEPTTAETRALTAATAHPAWNGNMTVSATATTGGVTVSVSRSIPFRFIAALVPGRTANVTVSGYAEPTVGG